MYINVNPQQPHKAADSIDFNCKIVNLASAMCECIVYSEYLYTSSADSITYIYKHIRMYITIRI